MNEVEESLPGWFRISILPLVNKMKKCSKKEETFEGLNTELIFSRVTYTTNQY